jgi:hypothetical protein
MKSCLWKEILAAAIALLALSGAGRAQITDNEGCSNARLKGDYGFATHGVNLGVITSTGTTFFPTPVPVDGVGIVQFDGAG